MSARERLMVAATLDELRLGEQFLKLPPHVTVYPWFDLPTSRWKPFDNGMRDIIEETDPPTVKGGTLVMYGQDESETARRLDRATPTFNLLRGFDIHAGVFRLAHILGFALDDTYTGVSWSPHVTDTSAKQLSPEEEIKLSNLTVFAKDTERGRKVARAIYKWSNQGG